MSHNNNNNNSIVTCQPSELCQVSLSASIKKKIDSYVMRHRIVLHLKNGHSYNGILWDATSSTVRLKNVYLLPMCNTFYNSTDFIVAWEQVKTGKIYERDSSGVMSPHILYSFSFS